MKIKIKTSCSGLDFAYTQGQEVDVPKERAVDLIKARYAEEVDAPKTPNNPEEKQNEEKENAAPTTKPAGAKGIPKD